MIETVKGLADMRLALGNLTRDLKRKVVRAALRDAAAPIAKAARAAAPVLKKDHPYRIRGTLKRSIMVKASKVYRGQQGEIGVYVGVGKRKGLGGRRGARNPFDPFYWRFQEFGTRHHGRQPFMAPAFERENRRALDIFQRRIKERIDQANKRK